VAYGICRNLAGGCANASSGKRFPLSRNKYCPICGSQLEPVGGGRFQVGRGTIIGAGIAVLILALAGAGYYFFEHGLFRSKPPPQAAPTAELLGDYCGRAAGKPDKPLSNLKYPGLFERVLALPDATKKPPESLQPSLHASPDKESATVGDPLKIFEILYVYGCDSAHKWVHVGLTDTGPTGWLAKESTREWYSMLVATVPEQQRNSETIYFFANPDAEDAPDASGPPATLLKLLSSSSADRAAAVRKFDDDVRNGNTDSSLAAYINAADTGKPDAALKPYALPILDWKSVTVANQSAIALRTAGLNADARAACDPNSRKEAAAAALSQLHDAKRGIVFVIDTTESMQPYIDLVTAAVERIIGAIRATDAGKNTSFGLVAYRNNMDEEPQKSHLEYVVRTFQPLDPNAPPEAIIDALHQIKAASVPTPGWNEDAVAGLKTALDQMDWDSYDEAKFIVLISDAGALAGNDPKAMFGKADGGVGLELIGPAAKERGIVIFPLHVRSPQAEAAGNVHDTEIQYRALSQSNTDTGTEGNYRPLTAVPSADFGNNMDDFAQTIITAAERAANNQQNTPRDPAANTQATFGAALDNAIFAAQMRFLGKRAEMCVPAFDGAWVLDSDLARPERHALDINVMLTRDQLSDLAKRLGELRDQSRRASETGMTAEQLFTDLEDLSGQTIGDPAATHTIRDVLPDFIKALPYRSAFLDMTLDDWVNMRQTDRQTRLDGLSNKIALYRQREQDQSKWTHKLGNPDKAGDLTQLPLEDLP
jgi:serine/threonine-protein kinase PpkA